MPDQKAAEKTILTNVLLQQILETNKAMLIALGNLKSNSDQLLKVQQTALVVAQQSNDYLSQIAEGSGGGDGGEHTYTVKVTQLNPTKLKGKLPPKPPR